MGGKNDGQQQGASLELILRQLVQRETAGGVGAINSSEQGEQKVQKMADRILSSPDLTEMAQELIIKLSTTTKAA